MRIRHCLLRVVLVGGGLLCGWPLPAAEDKFVLVIHGGAGVEPRDKMSAKMKEEYRAALAEALVAGQKALQKQNEASVDAVEAAIRVLEDSPLFNAGKGAVFNREGRNELNSSIMNGKDRKAGAVAGVCRIRNPISAARAVMEKSPHVLFIGEGAERFARDQMLEMVSPHYFWTKESWEEFVEAEAAGGWERKKDPGPAQAARPKTHFGTVGAVALDRAGNLAAGTSTGGLTYVYPGRVGDSPIIGAGTYADNKTCGVSCTGHGEVFIRYTVASDIAARVRYKGDPLKTAVQDVLDGLPKEPGGVGGIIALDGKGNSTWTYNTTGMFRGRITQSGKPEVAMYEEWVEKP